jgi:predicted RNase H-like HicB family nuclease
MKRDLAYYRSLPYARRSQFHVEGKCRYWLAWIEELGGCVAEGSTEVEAFAVLEETFDDYIAAKREWNSIIPAPDKPPLVDATPESPTADEVVKIVYLPPPPIDVLFGRVGDQEEELATTGGATPPI